MNTVMWRQTGCLFMQIKIYQEKKGMVTMPIRVQNDLPVKEILEQENIFVMDAYRAAHQDIRPLGIGL